MLSLLLAALTPSFAASNTLSAEIGGQHVADPGWDHLTWSPWRTRGVNASFALLPYLDLTASFHRRTVGLDHRSEDYYYGTSSPYSEGYRAAWYGNRYGLGAALEPDISHWLRPYVGGQLTLTQGTLRLDDDLDSTENANQLQDRAFAPGFLVAGGARLALGLPEWPVVPALHVEVGYGWTTQLDYGDMGDFAMRGFAIRSGVGVMF